MPTYEYACTNCGHQWEEIQKISEPALTDCPKCSNATAKRQISGGNFILKGGGWYADLYSSSPSKKSGGEEKKSEAPAKSDSGSSTSTPSTAPSGGSSGASSGGSSSGGSSGGSSAPSK